MKFVIILFLEVAFFSCFSLAGGSIQGGGGSFEKSAFYDLMDEIRNDLENGFSNQQILSNEESRRVIGLMHRNQFQLILVSRAEDIEKMAIRNEDGTIEYPDAKNISGKDPQSRYIFINQSIWEKYFNSNTDTKHLILHEFLGLAKISDTKYEKSSKIYKPLQQLIPFNLSGLKCSASGWYLTNKGQSTKQYNVFTYQAFGDFESSDRIIQFSSPVKMGKISERCMGQENTKNGCLSENKIHFVKYLAFERNIVLGNSPEEQLKRFSYKLNVEVTLQGPSFSWGWGAATGEAFYQSPAIYFLVKLVKIDRVQNVTTILGSSSKLIQSLKFDSGIASVSFDIFNSELLQLLANHGLPFSFARNTNSDRAIDGPYNILEILESFAKDNKQSNETIDQFISSHFIESQSNVLFETLGVDCYLVK